MGLFRAIRESQLVVMFLTMLWFFVVCQYFIPLIIMLPIGLIPKVGVTWYRKASGWWDSWSRVAVMCIPFSWCMPPLHLVNSSVVTTLKSKGNALLLSTHCSRVDWLMGVYMGTLHRQWGQTLAQDPWARIGFVAEMTIGLMPVIGWARVLFGDILVARAFHHDRPRIEKNINEFHKSGITR